MHILIIPSWYKTPDDPFYASFIEEQARLIYQSDVKIGVLYPNSSGSFVEGLKKSKDRPEDFIDNGISTKYVNANSVVPRLEVVNFFVANSGLCVKKYFG